MRVQLRDRERAKCAWLWIPSPEIQTKLLMAQQVQWQPHKHKAGSQIPQHLHKSWVSTAACQSFQGWKVGGETEDPQGKLAGRLGSSGRP